MLLDFISRRFIKTQVFKTNVIDVEDLKHQNIASFAHAVTQLERSIISIIKVAGLNMGQRLRGLGIRTIRLENMFIRST